MTTKQKKTEPVKRKYVKKQKPVEKVVPVGWKPGDRWRHENDRCGRSIGEIDENNMVTVDFAEAGISVISVEQINAIVKSGYWIINPPVIEQQPEPVKEKTILDSARDLIYGIRAQEHGLSATESFGNIAKGWSVIAGKEISAEQVCLMMSWLKMMRYNNSKTIDSAQDLAGYAGILEKLEKGL